MAETCFCRTGLNRFKPRFKPPLAETCQPCLRLTELQHQIGQYIRCLCDYAQHVSFMHW